jgi:uncharacterized cupin superfamily protein
MRNSTSCLRTVSLETLPFPLACACDDQPAVQRRTLHKTLRSSLDVWEYSPGEFDWCVDDDQSAWVLSGSAEIELADGRMLSLSSGSTFFFPRGIHSHWVIKETLRTVTTRGC